ncbi:hypothetical protein [Buchananella hordeovulneris]|uniref:hypothetical protein n=1 Tax=Buchananella hordeovulneris TaxID=52770 RepID=UPI000F5DFFD9|nr:hypothetical protein [Buchananella hordeovulneris]RRD44063.1 hypothetical protein EII13_04980 [Buchananella hordeovulneris]
MFDEQVFEEMKMSALPISSVLTTPRPTPVRRHLRAVPDLIAAPVTGGTDSPSPTLPVRPARPRPVADSTGRPARPRPVGAVRPVHCSPGVRGQVPSKPQRGWARLRRAAENIAMGVVALGTVVVVVAVAAAVAGFGPLA